VWCIGGGVTDQGVWGLCSCIVWAWSCRSYATLCLHFISSSITSIFSCLSGVVVGVLIQSNERTNDETTIPLLLPSEDPRPWAIIGAAIQVLSGDLCWFLGKKLWYFLRSLDDELPLSHRFWKRRKELLASVDFSTDTSHSLKMNGRRAVYYLIGAIEGNIIIGPHCGF